MNLKQQQDTFLRSLLQKNNLEMLSSIQTQKGINNAKRLEVYQKSYKNRIIKLLKEDYCVFTNFMGNEAEELFEDYLDHHPSQEFSLSEIGRLFPYYIQKNPSKYKKRWLPDLVHFEWLVHSSFYKEYDPFKLSQPYPRVLLDKESNTYVRLNPSTQVQWSHWPLVKIYQDEKDYPPLPTGSVVWSYRGEVQMESLDKFCFQLIEGLQKLSNLDSIVESMDTPGNTFPQKLKKAFQNLASQQIVRLENPEGIF